MEALDILEVGLGIDKQVLQHVIDLIQRSRLSVRSLLPLVRRLVTEGARPDIEFFHSLLSRCMSFGGDGLGEALALCDIMHNIDIDFTSQTEAIAERIRQAHEDDPALAGLEAWDVVTPEIRGVVDEEGEEEEDWIQVREMTPETQRVLLSHADIAAGLDSLPEDTHEWQGEGVWTVEDDSNEWPGNDGSGHVDVRQ